MAELRDETLTLRISSSMSEAIDAAATQEERSRSEMARVLLRKGLSRHRADSAQIDVRNRLLAEHGQPEIIASGSRDGEVIRLDADRLGAVINPELACVMAYSTREAAQAFADANREMWGITVYGPYEANGQVRNLLDLGSQSRRSEP